MGARARLDNVENILLFAPAKNQTPGIQAVGSNYTDGSLIQ
jgi:hypothetical protein